MQNYFLIDERIGKDVDRENNRIHSKMYRRGECTTSKYYLCTGDCVSCPYHRTPNVQEFDESYMPPTQKSIEIDFIEKECIQAVQKAIAELKPYYQQIYKALYEENKSQQKLADELGIPRRTLRDHIDDIKSILQNKLKDWK